MHKLGISRGDRIALISNNRWEWVLTDYATLALGACTVPIYPTLSAEQTNYILKDSGIKLLIVEDQFQISKLDSVSSKLPVAITNYFVIDPGDQKPAPRPPPWPVSYRRARRAPPSARQRRGPR